MNPVRLTKPALELIRSMVGREIRATVVSASGGMLLLRSGGTLIEARSAGVPLKAGQHLFLKVEQPHSGSYRLLVLDPATPAASGGGLAAPLGQALPPGPLQQLFGAFLRHYARDRGSRAGEDGRATGAAGAGGTAAGTRGAAHESESAPVLRRMIESMQGLAGRVAEVDQGALAGLLQNLARTDPAGQAPDYWLAQGWSGESAPDDDADGESSGREPAEEYLTALGRLVDPPYYFLSDFNFRSTGRISLLLLSGDPEFRRISLYLHPERPEIADWLSGESRQLKRLIGDAVKWERLEIIGPRQLRPEGGGGILDLHG